MPLKGPHLQYKRNWAPIFNFGGRSPQVKFFLTLIYFNSASQIFFKFCVEVDTGVIFNLCNLKKNSLSRFWEILILIFFY